MNKNNETAGSTYSKIRYCLCSTGLKQYSIEHVLEKVNECGLHGVEIWSGHIEQYLARGHSLDQLKKLLNSYQLVVPVISEYIYLSKEKEDYRQELERIKAAACWCNKLECPRIRIFLGHTSSQRALASEWELSIQRLNEALSISSSYGVKLAVEIHNNTFADTSDSLSAMFRDAKADGLELIFDGFNLFVDSLEPVPVLEQFFDVTRHVHFKDYKWNHQDWSLSIPVSVLQGDANHKEILQRLLELGYDGMISFEYFGDEAVTLAKKSAYEVRNYIEKYLSNV